MKIELPIEAVPQGRPRFYRGIAYDPPTSKQFKKDVATLANSLDISAFSGAVKVRIDIYKSATKFKKGVTSKRYGDIDNLTKAILDGLNGVVWKDDSQIVNLQVTKNLDATPHIDLLIEGISDE